MNKTFEATTTININVAISKVWEALTTAEIIKKYFFGVDVMTDWKEGSSIVYKGMWEGKSFEDRGNILKVEPPRLLLVNYWSSFSGLSDTVENYQNVKYELISEDEGTKLTISQDNIPSAEAAKHSEDNWKVVLGDLKKLLEDK